MTSNDPWAPFAPTAKAPWDLARAAHLHRRAGFGATLAELRRDVKEGLDASIGRFLRPPRPTEDESSVSDSLRQGALDSADPERLKAWWLYQVLYGIDPLRERMTLFWHGHFATSNRKVQSVPLMLAQNELFRRHALGPFADLLSGVIADPAMLVWLDGGRSNKEKPNENFAREFLELFTLGVGHYTEQDIRAAARAFTGWSRPTRGEPPRFDASAFDDGSKTFLRQTGRWTPADVVRITLQQPATAAFLCRKLYRFFVSEAAEPSDELMAPLAARLREGKYTISHVVETILRSHHFYDASVFRQRVKDPVSYSAGLLRMLEVPRGNVNLLALAAACERQGQDLFYPPSVKGWDGGKAWLNSATVLQRGNWANDVVWGNAELGMKAYDPQGRTVSALVELLLQGDVGPKARALAAQAGRDGKPDSLRKALQLLLHCPEFQLM